MLPTICPGDPTLGRIALRSPDLYVDLSVNKPLFITWDSYGAAANNPVKIELWQDGTNGPQFLSTIAASAPDTGRYAWTPSDSALVAGTHGLRIQISSVAHPQIYDRSAETFTVPEAGTNYYVDASSGSNRNDGKVAAAPKASPVNLFRTYDVGAGCDRQYRRWRLRADRRLAAQRHHRPRVRSRYRLHRQRLVERNHPAVPGDPRRPTRRP